MSIYGFWLIITFEEAVILSASNATTGEHRTLDYVPGSAILGIAASRLYRTIKDDHKRFKLFHSGNTSFGNGYPISKNGEISIPGPLSVHTPKAAKSSAESSKLLINRAFSIQDADYGQLEQLRNIYFTNGGEQIEISRRQSMRTAINPQTGTALESQLFGYSHIDAGSQFACWVDTNDAETDQLLRQTLSGAARLGRSRSAEFGRCSLRISKEVRKPFATQSSRDIAIIYCLSDIALIDENGFPTRNPSVDDFDLPDGVINWDLTNMRMRNYSPFNAALRTYETERTVIEKGSVIVFNCKGINVEGCEKRVGIYQAAGLGHIVINPTFLMQPLLGTIECQRIDDTLSTANPSLNKAIIASASFKSTIQLRLQQSVSFNEWAEKFQPTLIELYKSAQAIAGAKSLKAVGPSKSQWGRLLQCAEKAASIDEFHKSYAKNNIFKKTASRTNGERVEQDEAWSTIAELNQKFITFENWFINALNGQPLDGESTQTALPKPNSIMQVQALIRMAHSIAGDEHANTGDK